MKRLLILFLVFGSQEAFAARKYRWIPSTWSPLPHLLTAAFDKANNPVPVVVGLGNLNPHQRLAAGAGELVESGSQGVGPATVDNTWMQTIFSKNGRVLYAAGEVFDEVPSFWLARVRRMESEKEAALSIARSLSQELRRSPRIWPAQVRLKPKPDHTFSAYWYFEFESEAQNQILFLSLGENGVLLESGKVAVASIDGKGLVYPSGPKWSPLTEVSLRALSGDGTLTNRAFRITSALDPEFRSPDLQFIFAETDRRFDLAQVYYTVDRALHWMTEVLAVELKKPLEIRLHVGDKGVSNAAFYHQSIIYLGTGDGITYQGLPRDPSVVIHEAMHALIDSYSGLPSEGEGGAFNEGFADFFTALLLQNPRMGDSSYLKGPYRRTLENNFRAYQDFTPGVYRNGSIVAATFWDFRGTIDDQRLAQLAFRTVNRLGAGGVFADFLPALAHASAGFLSPEEQAQIHAKAVARGWSQ